MALKKPNHLSFRTYKEYLAAKKEYEKRLWEEIFKEVLNSDYVKSCVKVCLNGITAGNLAFDREPYGFGEGCYYKSKRALLEDSIDQFFDNAEEADCPNLLQWLYDEVQDRISSEIMSPKHLKDYIASSFGSAIVTVEVDYGNLLKEAEEMCEKHLKEMTDEQIELFIKLCEKYEIAEE